MYRPRTKMSAILIGLLIVLVWKGPSLFGPPEHSVLDSEEALQAEAEILEAWKANRSGVQVQAIGVVSRVLPDDEQGSRHQRLIVRLPSGHTVLLAHNIDLAPRIPAKQGDGIEFRGEYEWNAQGGVVHWTHHDPQGRHEGGFIRHGGRTFE